MLEGMSATFHGYDPGSWFCEYLGGERRRIPPIASLIERLDGMPESRLRARAGDVELELFNSGITFTVYSDKNAIDRVFPVDVLPRVLTAADWERLERGIRQRIAAINAFLDDVYGAGRILGDGTIPRERIEGHKNFRPEMKGVRLAHGCHVHIGGIDLVRDGDGGFRVLEDNVRTPSGVSYVVENRNVMRRAFPDLMEGIPVRPVSEYGTRLHEAMAELAPEGVADPQVVLLSPGTYNSAYFEHVFLAREMGVPLVEGRDLVVEDDDTVSMRTIDGRRPVHVIYRRIDDDFLDPEAFRPDSMLGVPGLMRAYSGGRVALANAVGNGIADDKAIYAYLPRIVRYYLDEDPILDNVETHICGEPDGLKYTLDRLDELVVKPVGESGGYGITIGPAASKAELAACREKLKADPANFISQPTLALSVCPTLVDGGIAPRHVDLRPFAVTGKETWVLPGGLTRVALRKGSLIVNSSQGGGSKDTWVLESDAGAGDAG